MKQLTDDQRREWYATHPARHPNPYHWSHAARQFSERMATYALGRRANLTFTLGKEIKVPSADPRIISADELLTFCDSNGYPLIVTDESCCLMTEDSFKEQVEAQFGNMEKLGVTGYVAEAWDCEDFAFLMRDLIRVAHRRTPDMPQAGLAVGVFIYTAWGSLNLHAIVCAFMRNQFGEITEMVHAEPQSGKIVTLYKEELKSCMGIWI